MSSSTEAESGGAKIHPRAAEREEARKKPRGVIVEQPARAPDGPPPQIDHVAAPPQLPGPEAQALFLKMFSEAQEQGSLLGALRYLARQIRALGDRLEGDIRRLESAEAARTAALESVSTDPILPPAEAAT